MQQSTELSRAERGRAVRPPAQVVKADDGSVAQAAGLTSGMVIVAVSKWRLPACCCC
jgi:predicted metalloprotease with PDZ domain